MATLVEEDEAPICSACVGEPFLKAEIQSHGTPAECSFCGNEGKTHPIEKVAARVATALDEHYAKTPSAPSDYEYAVEEGGSGWEQEGDPALQVIQSLVDIDLAPAREILAVLGIDHHTHYEDAAASIGQLHSQWREFEKSIKTEARFFSPVAQGILHDVFGDIATEKTREGKAVVVEAGPGRAISALFRARTFQSDGKLEEALCRPDLKVGSPPPRTATAGRMNAHGISVFYGAAAPEVAVAEVRPPVGSRVVVGQFLVIRPVRLLDVEALRSVLVRGSKFDPLFIRRRERAAFLEWLSHTITMPVMPDDEAFEYLVTQVIADYLASTGLDGLVYPSVQVPAGKNVVLFHDAARVEKLEIPEEAEVTATLEQPSTDELVPEYDVWETLPAAPELKSGDAAASGIPRRLPQVPLRDEDPRDSTLRLDTAKLEVRHIKAVSFVMDSYPVARHRHTRKHFKFF